MSGTGSNLTFALDFDGTFTRCPKVWQMFVWNGAFLGHRFYMVTSRSNTEENCDVINRLLDKYRMQMPIVFCNRGSKLAEMERRGIKIDIWMDDDPKTLVNGF